MIVVADSTPLIALGRVGRLDLLRELFGRVLVPGAVYREIVEKGRGQRGALEVEAASWIERRELSSGKSVADALRKSLDDGESEAIALALELAADVVLIDERLGRAAAREFGLTVTGLVGVLIEAKRTGLETDPVPLALAIRNGGVWIGDDLIDLLASS